MSNKFYSKFEKETHEIIVLIQNVLGASPVLDKWNMSAAILGMVNCEDEIISIKKGRLEWLVTEEERNTEIGWNRFHKGQICRIKASKLKKEFVPQNLPAKSFNDWCVIEVLEEETDCPPLQELWNEYIKPVVIQDEILGTLTLNREFDVFEGSINWKDEEVYLMIEADIEFPNSWEDAFNTVKSMVSEQEKWDMAMRKFAAEKLTELANEWLEEDEESSDESSISEEKFARRISLSELSFSFENNFTAYYSDDDMFWGHVIEICGSLSDGIESANIAG